MAKFKESDIVYHKATLQRGVIVEESSGTKGQWIIAWKDKTRTPHMESELFTEEEYNKEYGPSFGSV